MTNLLLEDVRTIFYSNHNHLVYEFAVRWWYALPSPWPPVDYDYSKKLNEKNLRRVDLSRFKSEPDVVEGLKKVYEQDFYSGIFKDAYGNTFDLRPHELGPTLNNFMRIEKSEL